MCGTQLVDESKFCQGCGRPLQASGAVASPVVTTAQPQPPAASRQAPYNPQTATAPPRTSGGSRSSIVLSVATLAVSIVAATTFFMSWISYNDGYGFSPSVTGKQLIQYSNVWSLRQPITPQFFAIVVGLMLVSSLVLLITRGSVVMASIVMVFSLLLLAEFIDWATFSWSPATLGVGMWLLMVCSVANAAVVVALLIVRGRRRSAAKYALRAAMT